MLMIVIEVHYSLSEIKDAVREYTLIMQSSHRSFATFVYFWRGIDLIKAERLIVDRLNR